MEKSARLRLAIFVGAFSGFIALSYEMVWYRVLYMMTQGIAATFGLLLGAYLLGLAIGSRVSGSFCKGEGGNPHALRLLAIFVAVANLVAAIVGPIFAWSAKFTDFKIGLVVVAIGAAFLGAILPLVTHFGIDPDDRAGQKVSWVYLANILGSSSGSLITGFVLMDHCSLMTIARILLVLGFLLAAVLALWGGAKRSLGGLGVATLAAFLLLPLSYDRIYEKLVFKDEYTGQHFQQVVENKSGVITVAEDGTVYGSGIYDGVVNTSIVENDKNWILRAYVVGALHPEPKNVLMVGLSSGSWAQVIANLPGVEHLTVIEINPGYHEIIAAHPQVASVLSNPKVTIHIDDGRRWLQRHADKFDVIVMNTTLHWRAHATNLLSLEFLEIARAHLEPNGLVFFNTTDSQDVQLTAARAFPHLLRITNHVAVSDSPFHFDRDRWKMILDTMKIDDKPILDPVKDKAAYDSALGFLQIELKESMLERVKVATVVTDDNMVIEWREPLRYPELSH